MGESVVNDGQELVPEPYDEVLNINLTEDGKLEIIKRRYSDAVYASYPPSPVPDTIWKEVYGVRDSRIVLVKKVPGKHIPRRILEEEFIFSDDE